LYNHLLFQFLVRGVLNEVLGRSRECKYIIHLCTLSLFYHFNCHIILIQETNTPVLLKSMDYKKDTMEIIVNLKQICEFYLRTH